MEHLAIHLAYEAKVGGPVQCRWMYPFERKMHDLKKKALNKNRVEASICEAYILSEISFFCSHYFGSDIETRLNRLPRNIDDDPPMPQLVQPSTIVDDHVSLASSGGERVVIGEDMQLSYVVEQNEEECVDEIDDEEEDEFEGAETPEEEVSDYLTESDSD
ncbi:hypothetical protein SLA2020_115230 [Shorea laevis]